MLEVLKHAYSMPNSIRRKTHREAPVPLLEKASDEISQTVFEVARS